MGPYVFYRYLRAQVYDPRTQQIYDDECGGICFRLFDNRPEVGMDKGLRPYVFSYSAYDLYTPFNRVEAREAADEEYELKNCGFFDHDGSIDQPGLLVSIRKWATENDTRLETLMQQLYISHALAESDFNHAQDIQYALHLKERYSELSGN